MADLLSKRQIDLVINIPKNYQAEELTNGYFIRRQTTDFGIPLIVNLQIAKLMVETLERWKDKELPIESWDEYLK